MNGVVRGLPKSCRMTVLDPRPAPSLRRIIDRSNSLNTDNSCRIQTAADIPLSVAVRPRHMAIQRRGAAPDLPSDLGGGHGAGCHHCLRRCDLDGVQTGGRPPTRPRTRLAAQCGSCVRSRRSSTSNCPSAAKIQEINRPVALVVSMFSCSERRPMPRACNVSTVVRSWRMDRARRSEPGDDQDIAIAGELQGGGKFAHGPHGCRSSDPELLAPGGMEGVDLPIGSLQIECETCKRIADQHQSLPRSRPTPRAIETRVSGLSSGMLHGGFQDGIRTNRGGYLERENVFARGYRPASSGVVHCQAGCRAPGATDAQLPCRTLRHDQDDPEPFTSSRSWGRTGG